MRKVDLSASASGPGSSSLRSPEPPAASRPLSGDDPSRGDDEADPIDAAPFGALIWHSTGEDEGPDVGVSIKLGDDALLWCGEITNKLYEETENVETLGGPGGWWVILYDGPVSLAIAKCCDGYAAQDAFERLSVRLRRVS